MKITIDMHFFDGKSESFEVDKSKFIVGRSNKADVVVNKEGFSREHCLIEYADEGFFITDLGSTNGVRINNEELPKNVRTAYNSFLPLAIGFAENVILEVLETSAVAHTSSEITGAPLGVREAPKKVSSERESEAKTGEIPRSRYARPNSSKKNKDGSSKIVMILAIIGALAFAYYFFMQKEEAPTEAPQKVVPSDKKAEFIEF